MQPVPLPISERAKNERLFLLSKEEVNNHLMESNEKPPKIQRTLNRKKVTFEGSINHYGKTYSVNNGKEGKPLGLYVEPLKKIIEQFEIGLTKWRRVFVLRFDLHAPFETQDNKPVTDFKKRLFQKLKRKYGFKEIGYCWAREYHGKGKGQHYHWAIWLDGDLIKHSSLIKELIKAAWSKPTEGYHIPTIPSPFYFVDSGQVAQEAIYRVSYLAKTRGKGHRSAQTKDYQCSRMKA